jgi:lipoprotein-anchoring transpeptidase ErfK/SrfK
MAPLLLGLSGCVEVNRFFARPDPKPVNEQSEQSPQVAEEPEPIPKPQEKPKPGKLYEWSGNGRRVSRIVVNTDEQKARFYDGNEQIGWTTVASGIKKFPTPSGHFEVMEKVQNKRSNLYGRIYSSGGKVVRRDAKVGRDPVPAGARFEGASMPYFMRLTNDGIGLHAGPIPRPGRPASHGCIRMPKKFASVAYEHVDVGTKVSIVGSGPSYGNYVQKQRALAARERERREAAAREQAVAASGRASQGSPESPPVPRATQQASSAASAHSGHRTEQVTSASVSAPEGEAPGTPPVESAPAAAALRPEPPAPVPPTEDPRAVPSSDTASAQASPDATPLTQSAAPESSTPPASTPLGAPPVPGFPSPLSPVAPPPYYAPPMRPAAATAPSPIAAPAPVTTTAPTPVPSPVSSPAPTPATAPAVSPPAAAPPEASPAVSAEQPKSATEENGG